MKVYLRWGIVLFIASGFMAINVTPNPRDIAIFAALAIAGLGCMVGAVAASVADSGRSDNGIEDPERE
ncbi:hypothetical protein [Nonomuraea maritima]|uniref:hypothetical protein n=1 Tax=Nonomuraea maritima TaxID=683260 RepID=UPI00116005AD|nr:hypothetical protein [Nonomuraea maritima]